MSYGLDNFTIGQGWVHVSKTSFHPGRVGQIVKYLISAVRNLWINSVRLFWERVNSFITLSSYPINTHHKYGTLLSFCNDAFPRTPPLRSTEIPQYCTFFRVGFGSLWPTLVNYLSLLMDTCIFQRSGRVCARPRGSSRKYIQYIIFELSTQIHSLAIRMHTTSSCYLSYPRLH